MISVIWMMLLFGHVHFDHGPWGSVAFIQPPHIAAGIGIIRHHLVWWFQTR